MMLDLIETMHKLKYNNWLFKHFVAFVIINILAWGGGVSVFVTFFLWACKSYPFLWIIHSAVCAIFGISSFCYIITGKD